MSKSALSTRVNQTRPCPVCGATSSCSYGPADLGTGLKYMCRGVPRPGFVVAKETGFADFVLYRHEDDVERDRQSWHDRRAMGLEPRAKAKPASAAAPAEVDPKWRLMAARASRAIEPRHRAELAARLGLPVEVFATVPLLGHREDAKRLPDGTVRNLSHWTVPETDAAGRVIGIERRFRRECLPPGTKDKKAERGCNRGIVLPVGWRDRPGPAVAVEGFSCVMACTAAGHAAVSRPGSDGGIPYLVELFSDLPADRDILIVGEHDPAGRNGAIKTAAALATALGRAVKWALPPEGQKDCRDWLRDGGPWSHLSWQERGAKLLAHLLGTAVAVGTAQPDPAPSQPAQPAPEPRAGSAESPATAARIAPAYCSHCDAFGCEPACRKPARASISNAEEPRIGIHARALSPVLAAIVGAAPRNRPCRFPKAPKIREGVHESTVGTFDIFRASCGKCGACQERRRYAEKLLHCAAALAVGTHVYHQDSEADWNALRAKLDRLRKKLGRAEPFAFARVIQDGGRRFVVLSLPDVDPALVPAELVPTPAEQCARLMAGAIDAIPYQLPKHTTRIQSNPAWKKAGGHAEKPETEQLYMDLGPVELTTGPELDAAEVVADAMPQVSEVVRPPRVCDRIEDRLILRCLPDTEHIVFRRLCDANLFHRREMARKKRERTAEQKQERERRGRERRRFDQEAAQMMADLRHAYEGREHEATELIRELLA